MPRLSVWMIRAALSYLAAGFTFGALLLWNKGLPFAPAVWSLLPAHIEFLLFGWTAQLILGTAFWILPRFSKAPRRGNEPLAWTAFLFINMGIWLGGVGPLVNSSPWLPALGRLAEALAALAFAAHAWPRVKPSGA